MADYLLIDSRDPFSERDAEERYALAARLRAAGNTVCVYLVENGVMAARATARGTGLDAAIDGGVEILADEFSLRERAIPPGDLTDGVQPARIGTVLARLAAGARSYWQ